MDYLVILLLQIGSAVASLVLLSIGLAVIFGMMRVINLAHGEFLMLGGYAAIDRKELNKVSSRKLSLLVGYKPRG